MLTAVKFLLLSGKGAKSDGKMRAANVCGSCGKSNHRGDKV